MVTKLFVPDRRIVVPKPPSYLKLDMAFAIGAGTQLMDKSRYRSHGTISGAAWADGAHGRCLDFVSATPSYVEIPAAYTQLNFTSEDFSVILRFKLDNLTAIHTLLERGEYKTDGWLTQVTSTGKVQVYTSQSGAAQFSDSSLGSITAGSWFTAGFSRSGASVIIYIAGIESSLGVGTHINPASCTRSLKVGVREDKTTTPTDGKIEFLRVFGGIALPASAHLAWHNALA